MTAPIMVEIRGAGGSGKTTVARRVMARYEASVQEILMAEPMVIDTLKKGKLVWGGGKLRPLGDREFSEAEWEIRRRKRPRALGVELRHPENGGRPLVVLGAQRTDCGGVDTIPNMDIVYALAAEHLGMGKDVMAEGRIFSLSAIDRPLALRDHLFVVWLDVPVEECIRATMGRREASGRETSPERLKTIRRNVEGSHRGSRNAAMRLREAGVEVVVADREEAARAVSARLDVGHRKELSFEQTAAVQKRARQDHQARLF